MPVTLSRFSPRSAPTNSATNGVAGDPSNCAGVSYCSRMPPSRSTAMRSPEPHRLLDVVGHEHHGLAQFLLESQELALQAGPGDRVDGPERLVHQQHRRVGRQRSRHAGPLALTARQLGRVALGVSGRDRARPTPAVLGCGLGCGACPSPAGGAPSPRCPPRSSGGTDPLLDHIADPPPQPDGVYVRDVVVVEEDLTRKSARSAG